jgi:hypothetical protein
MKPRKLRIITGRIELLEESLNKLLNDYNAIVWSFAPVGDEVHGTVVLLHHSVVMQQMLAQPGPMRRN